MFEKKNWNEFRDSGLLWWINSQLHLFGYVIAIEGDYNKEQDTFDTIRNVYPARVSYRGFSKNLNTLGYRKVSEYLQSTIEQLKEEANG